MRSPIALILFLALLSPALAQDGPRGEATLPLAEVLELHRARASAEAEAPPPPPVSASLVRTELVGRLEEDRLLLDGRFEVQVLREGSWSRVRLLETGPSTVVSALPALTEGALVMDGPYLAFVTRQPGRHLLELSFVEKAQRNGERRRIEVQVQPAALATLDLHLDPAVHELLHPALPAPIAPVDSSEAPPAIRLFPESGRFAVAWRAKGDGRDPAIPGDDSAPPSFAAPRIDTVIPRAHASIVSTLEGRAVHRVLYELRFSGTERLAVVLPEGQHLEKLFVNGAPASFEMDEARRTEIEVTPEHSGQQEGRVELVLSSDLGRFNLSGQLHLELPRVSWPVHELAVTVRLPSVFHYARLDGSLEPAESVPAATYSYDIPTPGKALSFHQFLIDASAPHVNIDYAIDLRGRVFR